MLTQEHRWTALMLACVSPQDIWPPTYSHTHHPNEAHSLSHHVQPPAHALPPGKKMAKKIYILVFSRYFFPSLPPGKETTAPPQKQNC
jgi:hypothetical protein